MSRSKYVKYLRERTGYRGSSYTETQDFMYSATIRLCELQEYDELSEEDIRDRKHHENVLQGAKEIYFSQFKSDPEQYVIETRSNFRKHMSKNKEQEDSIMSSYRKECEHLPPFSIQENMTSVVSLLHDINKKLLTIGDNEIRRRKLETDCVHYERMLEALEEAYERCPELHQKSSSEFLFELRKDLWQKDKDDLDEI